MSAGGRVVLSAKYIRLRENIDLKVTWPCSTCLKCELASRVATYGESALRVANLGFQVLSEAWVQHPCDL